MARYNKGILAVITAACTIAGIQIDAEAAAQLAALIGAILVILIPNKG